MAIEYNFTLDMDRSKRDNNIAYARTGDIDSIVINADLVFGGAAYTPSGTNAFFECITPNGRSIRAAAEKTGSSVSVEVPPAAFQAAGVINVAYFRFETGASDNPTYVESTEPFAIVVREGIGDSIDAGDYIEEWRKLADQLEVAVAEVKKKAEQAETAIDEQKTEVDQLKAQAQKAIAGDVTEVEGVAQSAIAAINKEKADVADAAEDISAAGEQAINSFNSKGTSAINKFNTDSASAISKFNTDGTSAINQFNTNAGSKLDEVDGMITEAQGDVDAAITQLENKTQDAINAAQDALDGTTATNLQNAINRTLKLDVADMTDIPSNSSLSSFTNVGSYCCKTAATAATVGDCPIDDSPFNMYVFSSATSGQVMQLVVPIDMNGKPTAEWHVRFGTSSAMDPWSVIGGGADIAAGFGIDITGDAKKTVALDTTAFYQHHDAADIIQGSTEVTGGGRIKELTVYGNTKQNLWVNPSETRNGVTVTSNADGSVTLLGTSTQICDFAVRVYSFKPGTTYTMSIDKAVPGLTSGYGFYFDTAGAGSKYVGNAQYPTENTFVAPWDATVVTLGFYIPAGVTVSGTYRVMLNEGSEPKPWCPPGLNGVDELSIVTAGKNIVDVHDMTLSSAGYVASSQAIGHNGKPGKYVASFDFSGTAGNDAQISLRHVSNNGVTTIQSSLVKSVSDGRNEFSLPETDSTWNSIDFFTNSIGTYSNFQLELGSTATDYEPPNVHETPIDLNGNDLCSLPDGTRDELRINSTGNVTLIKRTQTVQLDGDASWVRNETPYIHYISTWSNFGGSPSGYTSARHYVDKLPASASVANGLYSANVDGNAAYLREPTFADDVAGVEKWMGVNTPVAIIPLLTPQEIDLPGIAIPSLASPSYMIYASSDVPAEIEAEVVKVDYLPAHDVYTKEEVDKKIVDAGGMPDIVPVSNGGTGVTTAAAERNRLGLGNTTGAVPIANGGTGKTTAKAAQNALLGVMEDVVTTPTDDTSFVMRYASPSDTQGAVFAIKATTVWNYIASKIRSIFGFSSSNVLDVKHGGTGGTSAKAAQNSLLKDMNVSSDALTDSSMLVGYNASPSASNGAVHKRSVSTVWDYIAGKVADKVWEQIKTKAIRSDTTTGTDLTLVGGMESMSQIRTSTLTLGVNEMSLDNSNAAPLTVNGEEVITEGNISSHLSATFDAKSVSFSTPLKQGQQKNIITDGGFTLEELRKYFVPGNLVLANFICGDDSGMYLDQVVPMVINIGDGMIMMPSGTTYDSTTDVHYKCIFGVVNNEQAGSGGGLGLADGVTMFHSVTEAPGFADRSSTSSLKGFTVFDVVSHAI